MSVIYRKSKPPIWHSDDVREKCAKCTILAERPGTPRQWNKRPRNRVKNR